MINFVLLKKLEAEPPEPHQNLTQSQSLEPRKNYAAEKLLLLLWMILQNLKKSLFLMFFFGSSRIRIELKCWIRIWIQVNPDPQPWQKMK
jgi:hypothetical protein